MARLPVYTDYGFEFRIFSSILQFKWSNIKIFKKWVLLFLLFHTCSNFFIQCCQSAPFYIDNVTPSWQANEISLIKKNMCYCDTLIMTVKKVNTSETIMTNHLNCKQVFFYSSSWYRTMNIAYEEFLASRQ